MANENMIKFLRGNVASLPATATPGAVYFTKDEGLYLGLEDGSYHRYGDFITVNDVASLPSDGAHESCMYYCVAENVLAKWNESAGTWTQINKQKTLAELGGVAKSVYEAKMAALEKADTDNATATANLSTYVGTFTHATAKTVVEYINAKTDGIATSGNLEALAGRVTAAEGEIDALQAAIGEGGSVTTAIATAKAAGDNAQSAVDTLSGKVGTVEDGKTVVGLIGEAQTQANKGVADAATAQAKADEAYTLASGKATMEQVNAAIAGAGHAVKTDVDTAIENLDKAYKAADVTLQSNIDKKVDTATYEAKVSALEGADTTLQGNIDALSGKIGDVAEGKTVVKMIEEAQAAATYDDSKVKEDIQANADAIAEIEKDYLTSADKTALTALVTAEETRAKGVEEGLRTDVDAIKGDYLKKAYKEELQGNIDTLTGVVEALRDGVDAEKVDGVLDLVKYVEEHGPEVTGMKDNIKANADAIAEINDESTGILKQAKDYADGLAGDYAEAEHEHVVADITDFESVVEARITAKGYATTGYADQAEADAKAHAYSLNTAMNTRVEALEAIDHDHSNKTVLDGITAEKVSAWDAAEQNAKDYADGEITKLNIGQYAKQTDLDGATGRITTAEGKITALETASATHALKTEVEAVETALDTYKTENNAAVALKADASTVSAMDTAYKAADTALSNRIKDLEDNKAGYATTTQVATAKSEAISAAQTKVDELANGQVKTNTEAIAANAAAITSGDEATLASAKTYCESLLTWGSF